MSGELSTVRVWINNGSVQRCPHAPEGKSHTRYYGDGAHRWGPEERTGQCEHKNVCQDCGLTMMVDSSD